LAITRVPGDRFELTNGFQPGGVGYVTLRSVSLSAGMGSPTTPFCSRYVAIGSGGSEPGAVVLVVVVGVVDRIDW
jgi:hypothetical protein